MPYLTAHSCRYFIYMAKLIRRILTVGGNFKMPRDNIPEIEKIVTADGQPVLPLIHTITDNKYYLAKYQENFTSEGTPVNASVDVTKIDGLEITDGVSMTAESLKALVASESFNSSDDSAWTL